MPQCKWAKSLGELDGTHQEAWGTSEYKFRYEPTVFFGCYDLRDFIALWRHKGKAWVLWAGSDIRNLQSGFVLNDGKLKWLSKILRGNGWVFPILKKAEHWVENETEKIVLESLGIPVVGVCPSFLGNIRLPITYKQKRITNVFVSSGENRQEEYGFGIVERIAADAPDTYFHLYGAPWHTRHNNVVVHGRVSKKQFNRETAFMQIGLRLNEFEGFSEVLAKAVLRGQYAIGKVPHPFISTFENDMDLIVKLNLLRHQKHPNYIGRKWYRENLNKFPWIM